MLQFTNRKVLGCRRLIAISQIQEIIALAGRLRDVNPQEALDAVGTARALLQAPESQADAGSVAFWRAECALNAAWANVRLGRFGAAYPEAEAGRSLFQQLGKLQGIAGCILVMGIAKGEDGKNDEAVTLCLEAEAIFLQIGDQAGRARAINASGTSYRRLGDSARAIESYGASMAISRDNGDSLGVSRALTNIGYVYLYEKKYEQAIEYAKRALAMERSHGNLAGELSNCCNLVQALVAAGRPREAIGFMAGYDLKNLSQSGLFSFLELSQSLAVAYMEAGRAAEAEELLNLGIERARRDGDLRELGLLLCTLARLSRSTCARDGAARAKGLATARSALDEALSHGQSRDWDVVQGIHEEFCALCRDEGSWNEAFAHLEEAHRIALKLSSASADERLARQRSEREAAEQKARADEAARQHEIERKMLQSQKTESLGVLARGMVHHFNNLLTSILGYAELAELYPDLVAEALGQIKGSGRRAADLCQQLRIYTGWSDRPMAGVDVLALVRESISLLRASLATDCEFICDFPPGSIFVSGDRARLLQVILNLVTNSVEACATTVLLKAAAVHCKPPPEAADGPLIPGDYLELSVTDNGEGMTPEVLARIFEPFYSTKLMGRGLGMPAAMGLVRAHRGTMTVESKPGAGTTVLIQMPVASGMPPVQPEPPAVLGPKKGSRLALIADDEENVRRLIVKYMSGLGWRTLEAADGEEAVRMYRKNAGQVDLLLFDYLMPHVNGLEAARQIRSQDPELAVILMSGLSNEDAEESFRAEGFGHFLKKPFELQEIGAILRAAVLAGGGSGL